MSKLPASEEAKQCEICSQIKPGKNNVSSYGCIKENGHRGPHINGKNQGWLNASKLPALSEGGIGSEVRCKNCCKTYGEHGVGIHHDLCMTFFHGDGWLPDGTGNKWEPISAFTDRTAEGIDGTPWMDYEQAGKEAYAEERVIVFKARPTGQKFAAHPDGSYLSLTHPVEPAAPVQPAWIDSPLAPTEEELADYRELFSDFTLVASSQPTPVVVPDGATMIQQERRRQVESENWTPGHDDEHTYGQMAIQAAALAVKATDAHVIWEDGGGDVWGLAEKHCVSGEIKCLKIAGALIAAEIDRVIRRDGLTVQPASMAPVVVSQDGTSIARQIVTRLVTNALTSAHMRWLETLQLAEGEDPIDREALIADSLAVALGDDIGCLDEEQITPEFIDLLFVESLLSAHPTPLPADAVKETTYSIRVSREFVERVESRIGMDHEAWDVVEPRQLCEEVIAEYQANAAKQTHVGREETTDANTNRS